MTTFESLIKKYEFDGTNFIHKLGRDSGSLVKKFKLYEEFDKLGIPEHEWDSALNSLSIECTPKESQGNIDYSSSARELYLELGLENNFKLVQTSSNPFPLVYEIIDGVLVLIGHRGEIDGDVFLSHLKKYGSSLLKIILDKFSGFALSKRVPEPTQLQIMNRFLELVMPFDSDFTHMDVLDNELHPVTVEGCNVTSLVKIPYIRQDVLKTDLNAKLIDLLDHMTNHEYLCAIIWGALNGIHYPYLIYIKGHGGDGKSSFISMLGKLFKNSIATFQEKDKFSNRNMYNKGIINITENTNPYLLSKSIIKSITGGNYVNIEGKGKDGFNGQIMGLMIADSNINLSLLGEDFESRRLRFYEIVRRNIKERSGKQKYLEEISSTPNEFLNYCRQCHEKLGTIDGLVKPEPNQEEILLRFADPTIKTKFNKFIEKRYKNTIFQKDLKIDRGEINLILLESFPRDEFVIQNFERFLKYTHNVEVEGAYYLGWGIKPVEKSNVGDNI
jgi:hypothetical protein